MEMLKFFHSPASCSDGILLILSELDVEFEIEIVNVKKGMQREPAFLEINPKGKVPAGTFPFGFISRKAGSRCIPFFTFTISISNSTSSSLRIRRIPSEQLAGE